MTLLVATGSPRSKAKLTETFSLFNASKSCNKPVREFPIGLNGATGGVLYHNDETLTVVIVCGGYESIVGRSKTCFYYPSSATEWSRVDKSLGEKRKDAAGIVIDYGQTLWITGGEHDVRQYTKSTELVSLILDNSQQIRFSIQHGPDLPLALSDHCLVKLNSTTAMVIGGDDGTSRHLSSTYFLDIPTKSEGGTMSTTARSVKGPDLNNARSDHSCGVLTNPGDDNGQVVIVAGGYGAKKSTEMWVVGSSQGWTRGPDLPRSIQYSAGITSPDSKSFFLIGGEPGGPGKISEIYRLKYENAHWQWTKMDQELQVARRGHVAMRVPDSYC